MSGKCGQAVLINFGDGGMRLFLLVRRMKGRSPRVNLYYILATHSTATRSSFIPPKFWIGVVFFWLAFAPGLWAPAIVNILDSYDAIWAIDYTWAVGPGVAILSSLIFASLADRKYHAQNLLGVLSISGAVFLWLAFSSLEWGWNPWWFVFFQACNVFIAAPLWILVTKVTLVHSSKAERDLPLLTIFGTLGWISAGLLVSWLELDASATTGKISCGVRILVGLAAFMMPKTPHFESLVVPTWKEKLGLSAFVLFENRKLKVLFITVMLLAIPMSSFYMYAPKLLKELAAVDTSSFAISVQSWLPGPSAQMTLGQVAEIGALLLLSYLGVRVRLRWIMAIAMTLGMMRFAFFALAGENHLLALMWLGVALHGPIFAFSSITGQMFVDRQVPNEMRAQALALMSLMTSVGGVIGPLAVGQLYKKTADVNSGKEGWNTWPLFWWVLTIAVFLCLVYFLTGYRDEKEK
jgi:MFS family permease